MWYRELFIWFCGLHLILHSISCFELTLLLCNFRIVQLFPFLQNHISRDVTLQSGNNGVHFLPLFSLGCTISAFWFIRCYPNQRESVTCTDSFCHIFLMGHSWILFQSCISYHSVPCESNTSVPGLQGMDKNMETPNKRHITVTNMV
jgi:hypothetical protein